MVKVYYGCKEWWDVKEFEDIDAAVDFIDDVETGKVSYGLYTADYARLEEE